LEFTKCLHSCTIICTYNGGFGLSISNSVSFALSHYNFCCSGGGRRDTFSALWLLSLFQIYIWCEQATHSGLKPDNALFLFSETSYKELKNGPLRRVLGPPPRQIIGLCCFKTLRFSVGDSNSKPLSHQSASLPAVRLWLSAATFPNFFSLSLLLLPAFVRCSFSIALPLS
jgi:hypothetical protein